MLWMYWLDLLKSLMVKINGFFCRFIKVCIVVLFFWWLMFRDIEYILFSINIINIVWIICKENCYYNRNCFFEYVLIICFRL